MYSNPLNPPCRPGQDHFKQSASRLALIANRVLDMSAAAIGWWVVEHEWSSGGWHGGAVESRVLGHVESPKEFFEKGPFSFTSLSILCSEGRALFP